MKEINPPKRLKDLGEFGLIDRIAKSIKTDGSVLSGIGDDAAVIRYTKDKYLLVTTDMILEGVHFRLNQAKAFQIGWKALGCCISDIAAMGGVPRWAVVSVGLPKFLSLEFVDSLFRGIRKLANRFKINLVGGDTNASSKLIIDTTLVGEVEPKRLVLRSGAKVRDIIFVTGRLGGSVESGRHLRFIPRLREAKALVENFKINSMIDISDGLASDLNQIAKSSSVGAVIYEELIPLSKDARSVSGALYDGEDFELLFTTSAREARLVGSKASKLIKIPITRVGEVTERKTGLKLIEKGGRSRLLRPIGYSHF